MRHGAKKRSKPERCVLNNLLGSEINQEDNKTIALSPFSPGPSGVITKKKNKRKTFSVSDLFNMHTNPGESDHNHTVILSHFFILSVISEHVYPFAVTFTGCILPSLYFLTPISNTRDSVRMERSFFFSFFVIIPLGSVIRFVRERRTETCWKIVVIYNCECQKTAKSEREKSEGCITNCVFSVKFRLKVYKEPGLFATKLSLPLKHKYSVTLLKCQIYKNNPSLIFLIW